jgi:chromosome segregation ATPase
LAFVLVVDKKLLRKMLTVLLKIWRLEIMTNITEYEQKLKEYNAKISNVKQDIEKAEKDILVAQTKIENYTNQMKELEEQCIQLTGSPITEIDSTLATTMTGIENLIAQIEQVIGG